MHGQICRRGTAFGSSLIALLLSQWMVTGCKSTKDSETKDLSLDPSDLVNEGAWVQSCEAELANPSTTETAKSDLIRLTGQSDCRVAYPIVKNIVQKFLAKP